MPVAPETIRGRVQALLGRSDGTFWVGMAAGGPFRIEGGRATAVAPVSELSGEGVTALFEDTAGTLWIGTRSGIWRLRRSLERLFDAEDVLGFRAAPRPGELWVLTPAQVFRRDAEGAVQTLERLDPLVRTSFRPR